MKKTILILPMLILCACKEPVKKVDLKCEGIGNVTVLFNGPSLDVVSRGMQVKNTISVKLNDNEPKDFIMSSITPDMELISLLYYNNNEEFYIMQIQDDHYEYHFIKDKKTNNDILCEIK